MASTTPGRNLKLVADVDTRTRHAVGLLNGRDSSAETLGNLAEIVASAHLISSSSFSGSSFFSRFLYFLFRTRSRLFRLGCIVACHVRTCYFGVHAILYRLAVG